MKNNFMSTKVSIFSKIKSTFTQIIPKALLGTNTNLNHRTHLTKAIIVYFIKNSKKTKKQKDTSWVASQRALSFYAPS